jgi:Taurine catabolism dioxygenase TauD, TfdA family
MKTHSAAALIDSGLLRMSGFPELEDAFGAARSVINEVTTSGDGVPLSIIGDFSIPPSGTPVRNFQTLHFDFGLPLDVKTRREVARYTALHIPRKMKAGSAVTRLVPLDALLGQRTWASPAELTHRLVEYGKTHGAWDDADGYQEGSLARIVEAAAGGFPRLPSVKTNPNFLCGMEFDSLDHEVAFLKDLGTDVERVQIELTLRPGDLLVFDNLRMAHGRIGARTPGELHQRIFGHRNLSRAGQRRVRDQLLSAFGGHPTP